MKNIPILHVTGDMLAEAYENALVRLYEEGIRFRTQYDKGDDPLSIDATMNITINEPEKDPMIHKAFPGGIEDLREYVFELLGFKDHWVKNMNDPDDTRWEYTYHQRLADWGAWKERTDHGGSRSVSLLKGNSGKGIDQVTKVVEKLSRQPFTRQAQMITWMPFMDFDVYDPPCLQSLWYRLLEDGDELYLNCNVRFRSNDAWGANFMNMFGIIHFNREQIADPLQTYFGKTVRLGRMNWHADSYHIYGKDLEAFTSRFWDRLKSSSFEDRVYYFNDPLIQEIWKEAEEKVMRKIEQYDKRGG